MQCYVASRYSEQGCGDKNRLIAIMTGFFKGFERFQGSSPLPAHRGGQRRPRLLSVKLDAHPNPWFLRESSRPFLRISVIVDIDARQSRGLWFGAHVSGSLKRGLKGWIQVGSILFFA